jgi:iron complex outermembrane recepter protein
VSASSLLRPPKNQGGLGRREAHGPGESACQAERRRRLALVSGVVSILLAFVPDFAQAREFEFDLPLQPLSRSLLDFGYVAHEQVIYTQSLVAGYAAFPLRGRLSPDRALELILSCSGLVAERSPSGIIMIRGKRVGSVGKALKRIAIMTASAGAITAYCSVGDAHAQVTQPAPAAAPEASLQSQDDIVVTANRREEAIQTVGVSVQAFSAESLRKENIGTSQDLQRLVPGVVFSGGGSNSNTTLYIRGQGREIVGPVSPSVLAYENEVPLPAWGAIIPTYDMSNVQVLKGPQGTLFGRNTTGGAILTYSQAPKYEFGGYLQGLIGNYNWKEVEGAINIPLIQDRLAIRVAANGRSRDGYTKSGMGEPNADNLDSQSFRVSVLFEPTNRIKDILVYEDYNAKDSLSVHLTGYSPSTGPNGQGAVFRAFPSSLDCNISPSCDVDLALARQLAAGPRVYWSSVGWPASWRHIQGVSNTTTADFGAVTIKNIFGYRNNRIAESTDVDGTEMPIIDVRTQRSDDQITDELQLSGSFLGGSLRWLAGAFLLENVPGGPNAIAYDEFRPPDVSQDSWFLNSVQNDAVAERSHAFFVSLSQDLSAVVPGLKINASARYTWDALTTCAISVAPYSTPPAPDFDACRAIPGAFMGTVKAEKPTWSFGLDYQASDNIFAYIVTRRGYRAGGLNTPALAGILTAFQSFAPQVLTDVEGGAKTDWTIGSWRGRFNFSAYYGKFDDLQRSANGFPPNFDGDNNALDDPTNTSLILNAGSATIKGVDVDGFLSPASGLRITYGGSWFDGEIPLPSGTTSLSGLINTNTQFDNAPKWSYFLGGRYAFPSEIVGGELSVNADWYWVDSYKTQQFIFPSHHVLNASLDLDNIGGRGIDAQLFVQNLTDEVYFQNGSLVGVSPGLLAASYQPPRMFGLRLRYEFAAK